MLSSISSLGASPDQWIPIRWPGGPLEVARRTREAALDSETASVIRDWYSPETLEFLKDTPFNCLLLTWSAGAAPGVEAEQQRLARTYAAAARNKGLAVLGVVFRGADTANALAAAQQAGLDGVLVEDSLPRAESPLVIPVAARAWLLQQRDLPVLATGDAVAPGIRAPTEKDTATATPTSEPWIDSNLWLVRSLRAPGERPVWLSYPLRKDDAAEYARAIAEAAAARGRWIVSPRDSMLAGLARNSPETRDAWRRIAGWFRFFEEHAEWRGFSPTGPLGIVQDPQGKNADMAGEYLNLIGRRRIPYRVIGRPALEAGALAGLSAVLALDAAPPTDKERKLLQTFAEKGGLLVAGPAWTRVAPGAGEFAVQAAGAGRVVTYKDDAPDPEALSRQMLSWLGRNNLGVRLFNTLTVLGQVSGGANGRVLVQLINYSPQPAERVSVRVAGDYGRARLFRPGEASVEMALERTDGKVQATLDSIPVYAAALFEK